MNKDYVLTSGYYRFLCKNRNEDPGVFWAVPVDEAREVLLVVLKVLDSGGIPEEVEKLACSRGRTYARPWGVDLSESSDFLGTDTFHPALPFLVVRFTRRSIQRALRSL